MRVSQILVVRRNLAKCGGLLALGIQRLAAGRFLQLGKCWDILDYGDTVRLLSLWVITILLKMIAAENKFWGLCMMDQSSTQ